MLVVEGFRHFAGIPFTPARIFEGLVSQPPGAHRRKNPSIRVKLNEEGQ
jgi:hypothetical protein